MKKKYRFWSVLAIMMVAVLSVSLMSCGGDDDDEDSGGSSGIVGWYANSKDINGGIIEWIDMVDGWQKESAEMFGNSYQGLSFNRQGELLIDGDVYNGRYDVYNIVNSNTIVRYYGHVCQYGAPIASNETFLFKFEHNTLGTLALYGYQSFYYSYWIDEGKLYSTEPEIFTITSRGIIPDGSSDVYIKYDPENTY